MKSGRVRMMNGRGQVGIDLDPAGEGGVPPGAEYSTGGNPRSHSRSQSWSFNSRGQRPGAGELPSSLAALTPITSVIREIVPSFGGSETESSSSVESPLLISRAASQASLSSGIRFGDPGTPISPHVTLPHRTGGGGGGGGGGGRGGEGERGGERGTGGSGGNDEQQNIGFEISDGVRWLEHNAIFIVLLLLKFAWYHRSGIYFIYILISNGFLLAKRFLSSRNFYPCENSNAKFFLES